MEYDDSFIAGYTSALRHAYVELKYYDGDDFQEVFLKLLDELRADMGLDPCDPKMFRAS